MNVGDIENAIFRVMAIIMESGQINVDEIFKGEGYDDMEIEIIKKYMGVE